MMANSGFPAWTLWGMGLSAFGALIAIALAFLAQSPRLITRLNLSGQRLDLRAKSFTGYGLALLLLAMGFFMAGVPLGQDATAGGEAAATEVVSIEVAESGEAVADEALEEATEDVPGSSQSGAMVGLPTQPSGGASGAMAGVITPQPTLGESEVISGTVESEIAPSPDTATTGVAPAGTAGPSSTATRAPTVTPTSTPSPTPTATPILMPTARINDETSTLPVRHLPGGTVLVVLVRGDTVIPLSGNAFYNGELWQEVQTVEGVIGWVQDRFLDYGEAGDGTEAETEN